MQDELEGILSGLEQRLSRQLTADRQAIVSALAASAGAPAGAGGLTGPIVLLPDEPLESTCATCGRCFEPLRMAIHTRSCARLKHPPPASAFTAQQRADNIRRQAWARSRAGEQFEWR